MSFIVYGEHPDSGGHSEFARGTATGAVFKAADLIGNGWTGVHISDENYKIYRPDRFDQLYVDSKPNAEVACDALAIAEQIGVGST